MPWNRLQAAFYEKYELHAQVAFIFTDAEVKDEAFLEYINQLLMTGEVAGLFAKDEIDQIVNDIRPVMRTESPGKDLVI